MLIHYQFIIYLSTSFLPPSFLPLFLLPVIVTDVVFACCFVNSPESPAQMDWSKHYPTFFNSPSSTDPSNPSNSSTDGSNIGVGSSSIKGKKVEFADIGCGFGGLVVNVAPLFPETLMLG